MDQSFTLWFPQGFAMFRTICSILALVLALTVACEPDKNTSHLEDLMKKVRMAVRNTARLNKSLVEKGSNCINAAVDQDFVDSPGSEQEY